VIGFFIENSTLDEFKEKRVIEAGSKYANGSVRLFIGKFLRPRGYFGVDVEQGRSVDLIVHAERLIDELGEESCGILISTELLEPAYGCGNVIDSLKRTLKKDGLSFLTTKSAGFSVSLLSIRFLVIRNLSSSEDILRF